MLFFNQILKFKKKVLLAFKDGTEKRGTDVIGVLDIGLARLHVHAKKLCEKGLLERFDRDRNYHGETVTRITYKITPQGLDFLTKRSKEKEDSGQNQNSANMVIAN